MSFYVAADTTRGETHPVDEVLPAPKLAVYGAQHVLAFYAGAVIVPILLASAIGLQGKDLVYLISADLFTCGIASLIQSVGFWKVGVRLPLRGRRRGAVPAGGFVEGGRAPPVSGGLAPPRGPPEDPDGQANGRRRGGAARDLRRGARPRLGAFPPRALLHPPAAALPAG